MLAAIKDKIKSMFKVDDNNSHNSLEEYIILGNPQNANDVDVLTRHYYNKHTNAGVYTYFPNGGTHR